MPAIHAPTFPSSGETGGPIISAYCHTFDISLYIIKSLLCGKATKKKKKKKKKKKWTWKH
jgi:hypothetical protein